jgi:superfamily II DNA helicase RecQ
LKQFEDALRSQGTDDPLVALINDQVANLNQMGFDRAGYISSLLDVSEN